MKLTLFFLVFINLQKSTDGIDCTLIFPISQLPNNCTSMTGDLLIDGNNDSLLLENHLQFPVLKQKFSNIITWTGSVKILSTNFKNISFFKSLQSISTSWSNEVLVQNDINIAMRWATFWIENNPRLTSLEMPNLKTVRADVLPTVRVVYGLYIRANLELCMSEEEYWILRKLDRALLFEVMVCGPVTRRYCFSPYYDHKNMPLGCQILMSGIWLRDIKNTSIQSYLNEAFATVEEVHGPIVIFVTDFTNLSFPLLHTIRNNFYDGHDDWQWQVLIVRGNYFLTSLELPKLNYWQHFGDQPHLTNSANTIWKYSAANCVLFRKMPFFSIKDTHSDCGLVPIINDGTLSAWVLLQIAEKIASFGFNLLLCLYLSIKLFKSNATVNFFHFALVTLFILTMAESLFVNLDYVHIFNDNGFAIPIGLRSLLINKDAGLFNQISNVMYVNRLSLIILCAVYRTLYMVSDTFDKYGLVVACLTFIISNVWNLSVMEALQNNYTYVLFQLNWITLIVTIISGIAVSVVLRKLHPGYSEPHHNQLSLGLFLQSLWTFLICGYSDGLNQFIRSIGAYESYRSWETFFYWYGGLIIRWHYAMLIIIITSFLGSTFSKFPHRAKVVSVQSSSKNGQT